jgi:predicted permease
MMLIGMGLGALGGHFKEALPYTFFAQICKFVLWPVVVLILSQLGIYHSLGFVGHFSKLPYFTAFLPMAANTVAIAAEVGASAERAALAVLLSTLICWILIPLILTF